MLLLGQETSPSVGRHGPVRPVGETFAAVRRQVASNINLPGSLVIRGHEARRATYHW